MSLKIIIKKRLKIINNYCSKFELCEILKNKIKNPDDKILDNLIIYILKPEKAKVVILNKTCDDINDEKLKNAFKNGKNVVFETTGMYPSWLFKYNMEN